MMLMLQMLLLLLLLQLRLYFDLLFCWPPFSFFPLSRLFASDPCTRSSHLITVSHHQIARGLKSLRRAGVPSRVTAEDFFKAADCNGDKKVVHVDKKAVAEKEKGCECSKGGGEGVGGVCDSGQAFLKQLLIDVLRVTTSMQPSLLHAIVFFC